MEKIEHYLGYYYKVGSRIFTNKMEAILYANDRSEEVTWHFNEHVFKHVDWLTEPSTSLDEFYKLRAQQIRDKYDYVVILCSGGADSTNVVRTFLNNNIRVDEVIAAAPISGLRDYNFNDKDTSHKNTMSETKYAQLPLMNELSQQYPGLKITLHDYFEDLMNYESDRWLIECEDWIHPSSVSRYRYEKHKHLKDLAESGKKIAFVYGIDKPVLLLGRDLYVYTMFSDLTVNTQRQPFNIAYPNVENVLFYWTPDLPQMMVKQAHVVANWIFKPENQEALQWLNYRRMSLTRSWGENRYYHSKYERAIVPAIYPSTARPVFQAEKPERLFLGEHDEWFYSLHNKTRTFEMIQSDTANFFKKIHHMYLNAGKNGFEVYGNFYRIGSLRQFKINAAIEAMEQPY